MSAHDLTPLMKQYHEIKQQHADALVLFQVGDFYELFYGDAKQAASFLGIALTTRGKNKGEPIPLCGVPVHAADFYIHKLVKGGFKVALCEQLEEPKPGTVVKRGITQVLTPGTLVESKLLDEKKASYLFSFVPGEHVWGLLFGELLTAQLFGTIITPSERILETELSRFLPDEILLPRTGTEKQLHSLLLRNGYYVTVVDAVRDENATEIFSHWLRNQFRQESTQQLQQNKELQDALFYFYAYLKRTQAEALSAFRSLQIYKPDDFLILDVATQKNLELVRSLHDGSQKNSLFSVIDNAITPMGSRLLKKWLLRPLIKKEAILQRQDAVEWLMHDYAKMQLIENKLKEIGDFERIVGRIALKRASVADYKALVHILSIVPLLKDMLVPVESLPLMRVIIHCLSDFSILVSFLQTALHDDDTVADWIIKKGFEPALDYARELVYESNQKIVQLEREEQANTGISSLKIRYNAIHGYYLEITKANIHLVPSHYMRQQTLVGRERYLTPTLQLLQSEINNARAEIAHLESAAYERVKSAVYDAVVDLRKMAYALAQLDALIGFARVAYNHGYKKPTFNTDNVITIKQGRHPVVEQLCNGRFIPNDTALTDEQSLWIITGPNMGGKSTYLRQVALISILAQCGSFVPAAQADLPILDRIFTRIGAGDNLAQGKSTFLVEMEETATICIQATKNSLVILDEVGRGTSTFDGLALAYAIVEYLYTQIQVRCLFATHYHELTALEKQLSGVASYYATSAKSHNGIVFLYKIQKGIADGSFGIDVAKLAGVPPLIIERAADLLPLLQANKISQAEKSEKQSKYQAASTVCCNERAHKIQAFLETVAFDDLTPKRAFDILWQINEM